MSDVSGYLIVQGVVPLYDVQIGTRLSPSVFIFVGARGEPGNKARLILPRV